LKAGQVETIILAEDKPSFDHAGATAGLAPATGNSRKNKAAWPDQLMNVAPEDGWANYETYIKNNLNTPPEAVRNEIHGDVEISFEVNTAGAMTNMKVERSLCDDCDAEAMRVIRDGPRWKLKKGSLGTAKLKLKF
jgi:TonB family protein